MARKMKDSGIEWIGEIPIEWSISKLKYLGCFVNGYAFKPEDWGDEGLPIIRIQDLTGSNDNPNHFSGKIDTKYLINKGDILVSWAATLDAFLWKKDEAWLNQHIFKAVPDVSKVEYFFFFWLIKETMKNMNNDNKHGIFMQHVTLDLFENYTIPLPPLNEQHRIASFLGSKCAEIDKAIVATKASIEEYRKLIQAIITEAVTKGLDPDVEMKDSRTGYIGTIPSKWKVKKLRFLGFCQNGISKGAEFFGKKGYPFVSYSDVYKNIILPIPSEKIDSTQKERALYSVEKGDIFFTRTSETIEEIGFSSVCLETIPDATFAGFLIRVRPINKELNEKYSSYYFRSDIHRRYFTKEMNLVTRASLGQTLLKNMPILIPAMDEQQRISDYLDTKCSEIDSIIKSKEKLIEELTAYRKSLISEYVTGKKEVPAV